ncbi:uncharacterized protein LOC131049986 isoform X2 [Cryptomeria japonica]|uniref:uncharacterized protein LOC131049986 isoform X2 n=1 Tax=Cryptomeria japonica TaxID=3369 RepID=UPI0027D9FB8B|nr:uncharacterized protein LOC131049986 isoform X2 [Cryptomeria japonica]
MADTVQYKLERMIPELDDLEKRGLFNKTEIKEVVRRRRDFEYQLKRPCPLKEDYLRYIEYEKQLEALRNLRKKEVVRGLKENNKKWHFSLCDKASARRILDIYRRLLTRNKGDLRLWFEYAEFCREHRNNNMKKVLGKALNYHPNVPGLWIYAAAWEFERNLNVNAARALMLSGIRACPKSEILWLEYFRMELIFVNKLRARKIALGLDKVSSLRDAEDKEEWKKENSDLFMSLNEEKPDDGEILETESKESELNADVLAIRELGFKMAYVIFNKAVDAIPSSLRFRQQFVEMLDHLDVEKANALEDEMCRSMQKDFANDESCWDWLARRHISRCQRKKHTNKDKVVAALNNSIQVYEDALNTLTSSKMFGYYTKFLQNLIDLDKSEVLESLALFRSFVSNAEEIAMNLINLYERAECLGCLDEDLAEEHICFLLKVGDVDAARQLAAKFCTGAFSKVAKIWNLRMSLEIKSAMMNSTTVCKPDLQSLFELYKHVLLTIPVSEAHHLWHTAMEFFSSQSDYLDQILNMLAKVFSGGGGGYAGASLASAALDWVLQNQGLSCAREMYKKPDNLIQAVQFIGVQERRSRTLQHLLRLISH